ncbi:unnamed protein product, partial [Ceratitis capitata]
MYMKSQIQQMMLILDATICSLIYPSIDKESNVSTLSSTFESDKINGYFGSENAQVQCLFGIMTLKSLRWSSNLE